MSWIRIVGRENHPILKILRVDKSMWGLGILTFFCVLVCAMRVYGGWTGSRLPLQTKSSLPHDFSSNNKSTTFLIQRNLLPLWTAKYGKMWAWRSTIRPIPTIFDAFFRTRRRENFWRPSLSLYYAARSALRMKFTAKRFLRYATDSSDNFMFCFVRCTLRKCHRFWMDDKRQRMCV